MIIAHGFPEGSFVTRLISLGLDIAVAAALKNIGFDTAIRTMGDLAASPDKLWSIPHAAVMKFQDEHREEILKWLETKERHNFLAAPDWPPLTLAASRGKEAV